MGNFLGSLFGDLLGGFGSENGSSQSSGSQNSTGSSNSSSTSNGSTTPTEDPMFSMFRQSLLPAIAGQFAKAQQPVYGNAQIGQIANAANNNANAAVQGQNAADARSGRFNSGVSSANAAATKAGATGAVTGFESQIPFLNQQAQQNSTNNLLGLATNFLGRAPLGQTTSNSSTGNNTFQQLMNSLQNSQSSKNSGSGILGALFG